MLVLLLLAGASGLTAQEPDFLARARALHRATPLIDGHNDFPMALQEHNAQRDLDTLDIRHAAAEDSHRHPPPARRAASAVSSGPSMCPPPSRGPRRSPPRSQQVDVVYRMVRKYPDTFELARTAADVERIFKAGRIASLIGMEGGHSIDNSLATLRMFHAIGARYMTLTHSTNIAWADSGTDMPRLGGLSTFGEEVVREMNRLGHAGRSQPHVARHDGGRDSRLGGAGDFFAFRRARAERSRPQRARRGAACPAEERRHRDGDVRARIPEGRRQSDGVGRRRSHGSRPQGRRRRSRGHRRRLRRHSHRACRARRRVEVSRAHGGAAAARVAGRRRPQGARD